MTEFDFLLSDRITKIKSVNELHNIQENGYIAFSGGRDSTVLSVLIDMALPSNKIPRIFCDTGIEYEHIKQFVEEKSKDDERIKIIKPSQNIRDVLEKFGYPFKSKEHSHHVHIYQNSGMTKSVKKYLQLENGNKKIVCTKKLKYQFTEDFNIKVSERCCDKLKKQPMKKWAKENAKTISIVGVRINEGGQRLSHKECTVFDKDNKLKTFKPLNPIEDDFINEFIKKFNVQVCNLYNEPYNFRRTGCKGCPFSLDLKEQLEKMTEYFPTEKKQCELIWGKVYDEYRRIDFRL